MSRWVVAYKVPGSKAKDQTVVEVDGFDNAKALQEALEEGTIPNAYFVPGSIIYVQLIE